MSIATDLSKLASDITSAYSAVSNKGGTIPSHKNTDNLPTAINSIPAGGGSSVEEKNVNFYDYDGTLVQSYTKSEFLNLSALPSNPSHSGLTAQGWNWSLSDAKTYVTNYDDLNIGQMYTTDDGKTRIYVEIDESYLNPYLTICLNGTCTIDWGDNTTDTITGTSLYNYTKTQHAYNNTGTYLITLTIDNNSTAKISNGSNYSVLFRPNDVSTYAQTFQAIKKVELGNNVSLGSYAFEKCISLEAVTIPNTLTSISSHCFGNCFSLKYVTIPNSATSIGEYAFYYNVSSQHISIPNSVVSIGNYVFGYCSSLNKIKIPTSVTSIGTYCFCYCYSLETITIPSSVTSLGTYDFNYCTKIKNIVIPNQITTLANSIFQNCYSLETITISSSVTSIGNYSFQNCYSLKNITIPKSVVSIGNSVFSTSGIRVIDFSSHETIPTLGTSAFSSIGSGFEIRVPSALYNDWIAATNWSNYASNIVAV